MIVVGALTALPGVYKFVSNVPPVSGSGVAQRIYLQVNGMLTTIAMLRRDERGVTAIEYGLIAALISVVIIIAVKAVGTSLSTTFTTIANSL